MLGCNGVSKVKTEPSQTQTKPSQPNPNLTKPKIQAQHTQTKPSSGDGTGGWKGQCTDECAEDDRLFPGLQQFLEGARQAS
jgi:hypothetical protein